MKEIKKLFSQTGIYGLGTIAPRILNYSILTPFYTRVLPTGEYGTFSYFYAYVSVMLIILTYGMETAFFRFFTQKKSISKVFGTSVISLLSSTLLFIIILFIFGGNIAELINFGSHPEYVYCLGLVVAIDAFSSIGFAKLRIENKAYKFSIIKILNVVVTISLIFILFEYADSWLGDYTELARNKVFIAFFCNLVGSAVSFLAVSSEYFTVKYEFDAQLLKNMLKYAAPLLLVGICGSLNENLDKIVLKNLLPQDIAIQNVGIYAANYKIAVLMTLFIQMFRYAAEPFFFSQHKKSGDKAKTIYAKVMKYFVAFCLFIFLFVMFYIDIIKSFIGEDFSGGLEIVPIVLLANFFLGVYFNLSVWYKLTNKTYYGAIISVIGTLITLLANFIFIPIIGYMASAWATFACYFVMMTVSYFMGQKHYKIDYPIETILIYFLAAISLFFISELIIFETILQKLGIVTLLLLIYLVIVFCREKSENKKERYKFLA